ncbi:C2H2-type zinc finger protein [Endozoicomonas euniceicola]|uniref:C2H2-type zinc finger protein n=1 Tax=Endozoicomonas euniceicola TaxID=1234143 RepID=A0ABY6H0C3_9GAMM|nr:C2H2-type zinc finger protein [Endozoicomonas euniceicola]UYM18360.1 C2H2-type zinc finger protein [Endozoicomonas euniceicola]
MPQFICDVCLNAFRSRSCLAEHMRTHTGEKPFQCPICPKAFSTQSNFRKHERVHTGEKPYECETCRRCFADRSSLNRHRKIHISNKQPFHCLDCNKIYTTAQSLRQHRGKKHSNQGISTVTTVHSQVEEPTGVVMTTTQTIASSGSATAISNIVSSRGAACSVTQYMPAATFRTVIQKGEQTAFTEISYPPLEESIADMFPAIQHELRDNTAAGNRSESNDPIQAEDLPLDFWLD